MQTTSHFIGIDLNSYILSDIFIKISQYFQDNNMEDFISFQNPLSPHITLYYLEKNIDLKTQNQIKKFISSFDLNNEIKLTGFDYFYRGEGNKFVLYLKPESKSNFLDFRNIIHNQLNRDFVVENNYTFLPHITIFKINNSEIFENHRSNIETILNEEIKKIKDIDISLKKMFLYAVNSKFKEEIQIKI